jgi:serine protease Do
MFMKSRFSRLAAVGALVVVGLFLFKFTGLAGRVAQAFAKESHTAEVEPQALIADDRSASEAEQQTENRPCEPEAEADHHTQADDGPPVAHAERQTDGGTPAPEVEAGQHVAASEADRASEAEPLTEAIEHKPIAAAEPHVAAASDEPVSKSRQIAEAGPSESVIEAERPAEADDEPPTVRTERPAKEDKGKPPADTERQLSETRDDDIAALERLSRAFGEVVDAVKPAVVHIQAIRTQESLAKKLQELFSEKDLQLPPVAGTGSGVIIDQEGYIVTNNHVVADAQVVRVTLADGRKFRAEVIGSDRMTDVAVLKIHADRLHPAKFGDSDKLKSGNIVLAIGSPFRLTHSVSHGIVSALGRTDVQVDIDYQNWIQTDAPINPGNSGGPLINTRGEVVGLNVAIATDSGAHQGVGFAIPSNTVARVAEQLKSGEKIVRGYLGVVIQQVDPKMADAYGLGDARGVFVGGVGRDSPAAKSGLKPEDIILAIEGKKVETREKFQEFIADTKPDTTVEMTVWRNGGKQTLSVTIGAQPDNFSTTGTVRDLNRREGKEGRPEEREKQPTVEPMEEADGIEFEDLGFTATTLSADLARRLKIPGGVERGAVIINVRPAGEAYLAGLSKGQLIVEANGKPIDNAKDLERTLTDEALAKGVRLKVRVGEDTFYVVVQVR